MVRRHEKDLDQAGRENKRLQIYLDKHKARWANLKENARARRAEIGGGNGRAGNASADTTQQSAIETAKTEGGEDKASTESDGKTGDA
jgi:hypothetical protein